MRPTFSPFNNEMNARGASGAFTLMMNAAVASRENQTRQPKMNYETYAHSKGLSPAHFQFTPAHRRDIFTDDEVKSEIIDNFRKDAEKLGVSIEAMGFGPDHVHPYLKRWKNHAIPKLAQQFKGHSSRVAGDKHRDRIEAKLWGKKFWTSGYFFETVGRIKPGDIEWYVFKGQQKHWKNPGDFEEVVLCKGQMALSDYN